MRNGIKFMLKYTYKRYWFFLGYFALSFECITPIIATLLQGRIIDQVFVSKRYHEFPKLLALYAILFFSPKLWFTVRKVVFFNLSYLLQMSLSESFFQKVYALHTAAFIKQHIGKLLNHLRNDIAESSDLFVNQLLSESVKNILSILLLSFSLARINLSLLTVVIAVALIYYVLLHKFGKKTKQLTQAVKAEKSNVSIAIEESVSSIREVVAYNRQDWQLEQYEKRFTDYFTAIMKQGLYTVKVLFVSEPFLYGTRLVAILLGFINVISNRITPGEFVVGYTFVDQLVAELGQLFQQGLTGKKLAASVACIKSVMGEESVVFGLADFTRSINSIQMNDVSFRYSEDTAIVLHNLSIVFPVGKKIAIVGKSGSGKSTIAQLLLRFYSPDKGEVSMNGIPVDSYGKQYSDKVSMVFQQPYFMPATIKENLTFGREYSQYEIEKACKEMQCHDFIVTLPNQYETLIGERGANLSGGQKQRIALARALLKNTEVLILDEATSALDNDTEFSVQKNIDKLRKGKTTITIAHRMSTIQNADRIYVMDEGDIVACGTHDRLMSENPIYKELYIMQRSSLEQESYERS